MEYDPFQYKVAIWDHDGHCVLEFPDEGEALKKARECVRDGAESVRVWTVDGGNIYTHGYD